MKINQNNDISIYRGESVALDFKISQSNDYYIPFLVSTEREHPRICITIGSARRESNNIVSKQIWLDLEGVPRFYSTVVQNMGTLPDEALDDIASMMQSNIMYQFLKQEEVDADEAKLHFMMLDPEDEEELLIDEYAFTVTMTLNETHTLDMTNTDYFYQIELMDTVPMLTELLSIFATTSLYARLPNGFTTVLNESGLTTAITEYWSECIALATKLDPTRWGHRVLDPLTSPVASVSNIQMLQVPRRFTVQSVVK